MPEIKEAPSGASTDGSASQPKRTPAPKELFAKVNAGDVVRYFSESDVRPLHAVVLSIAEDGAADLKVLPPHRGKPSNPRADIETVKAVPCTANPKGEWGCWAP